MVIALSIAFWVVALSAWGLHTARTRRQRLADPSRRDPQEVWDETDPAYREWLGHGPASGPSVGS